MSTTDTLSRVSAVRADVVIVTALALEHDAVVDARRVSTSHVWRGNKVHVGRVGTLDVLVFPAGGMGNVGAAQAATLAIGV